MSQIPTCTCRCGCTKHVHPGDAYCVICLYRCPASRFDMVAK